MKTNLAKIQDRKVSLKLYLLTVIAILCTSILANSYFGHTASALPKSLDVEIYPKGIVKAYVNETITLYAISQNGTSPFTFKWMLNSSVIGTQQVLEFVPFTQHSNETLSIIIEVSDSNGNFGYACSMIVDPASINVYLDDLPAIATYTIKSDATNYWAVRYDGEVLWESTNASYTINSALSGGNVTVFLSGQNQIWTILNPIMPTSNTILFGGDKNNPKLFLAANRPYATRHGVVEVKGNSQNVVIRDLHCDANHANQHSSTATDGDAWFGIVVHEEGIGGSTNVLVEGCYVEESNAAGIVSAFSTNVKVSLCTVVNNQHMGIGIDTGDTDCTIENCYTSGNLRSGVYVTCNSYETYPSGHHLVLGNHCVNDGTASTYGGIELYWLRHTSVIGNWVINSKFRGIDLTHPNSYNVLIQGNHIIDADTEWGIFIVESDDISLIGNYVYSCGGGIYLACKTGRSTCVGNTILNNTGDGIKMVSCDGALIEGNNIHHNGGWGILIDTDSDDNFITSCRTENNVAGSIRVNNADCNINVILGNHLVEGAVSDAGTGTILTRASWDNV